MATSDEGGGKFPRLVIAPPPDPDRYSDARGRAVYDPEGPSMIDIVMGAAQATWRSAVQPDGSVNLDIAARAAMLATQALPYTNPKLAAVVVKNVGEDDSKRAAAQADDAEVVVRKLKSLVNNKLMSGRSA